MVLDITLFISLSPQVCGIEEVSQRVELCLVLVPSAVPGIQSSELLFLFLQVVLLPTHGIVDVHFFKTRICIASITGVICNSLVLYSILLFIMNYSKKKNYSVKYKYRNKRYEII